ncbi:MAG: DegT/DnrJ/EryC1/StrS family aminotransferase [Bacteroidota bacterium]|nr:DegT/DnrJ/EryC1/StrS family aminotransferase [Bacteroidota bacterium]MDX5448502.1 DegT/DnrJ/EryC1/StrS family aminotransferase [Bacteroidota bacterium]MDX5506665.1 DegT/DnrJ/EryC1/StrS family aminotransferase [Bacteroidota bacterium]
MEPIRMVDLVRQYEKIQNEVDQAVIDVIRSSAYINGPDVQEFQKELESFLDVKHVIPCANGTDALQCAMMASGLKPGDEVITATFTYVATAEVIALLQLTPVLVDVDPDTFLIDPEAIEKAITPKTRAIVPVHLFGQTANMDRIMEIAKKHNLLVFEDTAQAIGSKYTLSDGTVRSAGTIGHFGATSFFPSKNLGCMGDGGAIFTNDDEYARKLRMIVNHGQSKRYYHDEIGVNSRLDTIQAAVLRIKLRRLHEYNEARRKAADYYDAGFAGIKGITTPKRAENSTHVFHQYTLKLEGVDRNGLQEFLAERDIPSMIYYPVALHMQSAYQDPRYKAGDFPVTENLVEQVISLPIHTELDKEQQDLIINSVIEYINR